MKRFAKKKDEGGPLPDPGVRDFYREYLNSPNYLKRLQGMGYNNPQQVTNARLNSVNKARVSTIPGVGGQYDDKNHMIIFDPEQSKEFPGMNRNVVVAHEYGHAAGAGQLGRFSVTNPSLALNNKEIGILNSKNKYNKITEFSSTDQEGDIIHDQQPGELKADIDAFRYKLKKDGIYDTGTQEFNQQILNKVKPSYSKDPNFQRTFNRLSDKDLIYIMNNIAGNQPAQSDMGKNGLQVHPTLDDIFSPLSAKSGAKIKPKASIPTKGKMRKKADDGIDLDPDGNVIRQRATFTPQLADTSGGMGDIASDFGPAPTGAAQSDQTKKSALATGSNAFLGVASLIDAAIPNGRIKRQQVVRPPWAYNQHPYGAGVGASATMDDGGTVYNPPFNNGMAQNVAEDKGGAPRHYYHADDDYYDNGGQVTNPPITGIFGAIQGMTKIPSIGAGGSSGSGGDSAGGSGGGGMNFAQLAPLMAENGWQFGGYKEPSPSPAVNKDNSANYLTFDSGGPVGPEPISTAYHRIQSPNLYRRGGIGAPVNPSYEFMGANASHADSSQYRQGFYNTMGRMKRQDLPYFDQPVFYRGDFNSGAANAQNPGLDTPGASDMYNSGARESYMNMPRGSFDSGGPVNPSQVTLGDGNIPIITRKIGKGKPSTNRYTPNPPSYNMLNTENPSSFDMLRKDSLSYLQNYNDMKSNPGDAMDDYEYLRRDGDILKSKNKQAAARSVNRQNAYEDALEPGTMQLILPPDVNTPIKKKGENGWQFGGYREPTPSAAVNKDNSANYLTFDNGGELTQDQRDNLLVWENGGVAPSDFVNEDNNANLLVWKNGGKAKGKYGYRLHQDPKRNTPTFDDGGYIKKLNSKGKVIPNILANGSKLSPEQARSDKPYNQMTYYGKDIVAKNGSKISPEQAKWDYPYTQMTYKSGGIIPPQYGKDEDMNKLTFAGGGAVPGFGGTMAGRFAGAGPSMPQKRQRRGRMDDGGRMIAGGLGGPGKSYRKGKYADSFDDSKLLTAEYDDGGGVGPDKPVSQMSDAEVHAALHRPVYVPGDTINIPDRRKVNPTTGAPMTSSNRRDTQVNTSILRAIGEQARAKGVDPNDAAAIALQETNFGADEYRNVQKLNNSMNAMGMKGIPQQQMDAEYNESYNNMGHAWAYNSDLPDTSNPVAAGANKLAGALKEKNAYAHQLGMDKMGDAYRLQTYNGLGKLTAGTQTMNYYGHQVSPGHPLNLRENPLYGKTVVSLRDQMLRSNPAVQNALNKPAQYLQPMADGGAVDVNKVIPHPLKFQYGGDADVTSQNPYAGPTMEFKGPSHEDGGIGMSYAGNNVEVEGGETGVVDKDGDLNVMGNMTLPGTGKKFKSISKDIADRENAANRKAKKGDSLMDNNDPNGAYEYLNYNSGKAMKLGADMRLKQLAKDRDNLGDVQKMMLDTANRMGIEPQDFSQGKYVKAKMGARIAANGDVIGDPDGPGKGNNPTRGDRNNNPGNIKYGDFAKSWAASGQDADGFAIFPSKDAGRLAMRGLLHSSDYSGLTVKQVINKWTGGKPYDYKWNGQLNGDSEQAIKDFDSPQLNTLMDTMTKGEGTRYGLPSSGIQPRKSSVPVPIGMQPSAPIVYDPSAAPVDQFKGNYDQAKPGPDLPNLPGIGGNPPSSALNNKLDFTQVLPEAYAVATNREISVPAQKYQPQLLQPYKVSFQDRINDNRENFSAMAKAMDYNPSALSVLGAQKYSADNSVRAEEFRTNQGISQEIANKNTEILNDAQYKNLQLADQQMVRQATARAKTKAQYQEALNSVASKSLQNSLENRKMELYEGLFDYRLADTDGDGKVDSFKYKGPDAQLDFSGLGKLNGGTNGDARQTVTRDRDGNVRSTRTTSMPNIQEQLMRLSLMKKQQKLYTPAP